MTTRVQSNDFEKIQNTFSIKNFIADLPRMLNETFSIIYKCITDFYNPSENKIECNKLSSGYIDTTTLVTKNLILKGPNGGMYNYADLIKEIEDLKEKINEVLPYASRFVIAVPMNENNNNQ